MDLATAPVRIELAVGQEKTVTLPGLGLTGHIWQDQVEGPGGIVATKWERGLPPGSPVPAIGRAAPENLRIKGLAPGEVTLILSKRRPWERNVPPIGTHMIVICVKRETAAT